MPTLTQFGDKVETDTKNTTLFGDPVEAVDDIGLTKLSEVEERKFQKKYAQVADKLGLSSNPDNPLHFYDYRGLFKETGDLPVDEAKHFTSKYKIEGHPRMVVGGINTKTGEAISNPAAEEQKVQDSLNFSEKSGLNPATTTEFHDSIKRIDDNKPIGFIEGFTQDAIFKIPFAGAIIEGLELLKIRQAAIRLNDADFDWEEEAEKEKQRLEFRQRRAGLVPPMSEAEFRKKRDAITAESLRKSTQDGVEGYIKVMGEREERGVNFWGKIGSGLSVLPGWMFEFSLSGGLHRTASAGVKKILQKHAKTKILTKTAGWVAGSATRTTLGLPQRVFLQTMNQAMDTEQGWATSIAKGWGAAFIETASETAGEGISKGIRWTTGGAINKLPFGKKLLSELQNAWMKLAPENTAAKFGKKILTKAGYNGLIGEMGEERLATLMHAVAGTDTFGLPKGATTTDRLIAGARQDLLNLENIFSEMVVLSVPGAAKVSIAHLAKLSVGTIQKEVGVSQEAAETAMRLKNEDSIEKADEFLSEAKTEGEAVANKTLADEAAKEAEAAPEPTQAAQPTPEPITTPEGQVVPPKPAERPSEAAVEGPKDALFELGEAQLQISEAIKEHGFGGITEAEQHPDVVKARRVIEEKSNQLYDNLSPENKIGDIVTYQTFTRAGAFNVATQQPDGTFKETPSEEQIGAPRKVKITQAKFDLAQSADNIRRIGVPATFRLQSLEGIDVETGEKVLMFTSELINGKTISETIKVNPTEVLQELVRDAGPKPAPSELAVPKPTEKPKPPEIVKKPKPKPLTPEQKAELGKRLEARDFDEADISLADAKAILAESARPRKPRTEGFLGLPVELPEPEVAREKAEKIYQDIVNRFASIENATKKAKALGMTIEQGENPALRARSYLGLGRKTEVMLEKNTFHTTKKGEIEVTGEGLKPILDSYENTTKTLEPSRDKREKDFNDYLIAIRTVEDLQRPAIEGKENIASEEQVTEAQSRLDKLSEDYGAKGIAVFAEHADRIYEYQKRVLHLLVDAGNISQKQFDDIVGLNQHYIPFDRVVDDQTIGGVPVNKNRFTKARAPIGKIKGSELEIEPTMESVIKNTYKIVAAADRNAVAASLAKLSDVLPDKISPVRIKTVPIKVSKGEIGVEEADEILIFRASQFAPKGKVIEYFVDGKRKFVQLSGNLFDAMTGLNETSANWMVKVLSQPAHWLRVGATITPSFIARNPIRDQWTALMQTSFGFTPFIDPAGAVADIIGKSDVYNEWLASGGAYSGFVELNRPSLEKAVKELRKGKNLFKKLNPITQAQNISQLMEMATRLGAFKAAKRKGLTAIEAGFESREASIDFARRGAKLADFNQMMAFFNAGIQGLDKTIRTFINHPYQTAIKGVAAITIPSLLLYLRNRKEEDFSELAQWQKDLFWNFKIGDTWWRVPKPFLLGQLFGSIPERFFEFLDTKDTKAFDELAGSIIDSVTPISGDPAAGILPTAIKPIIENATNQNFFLERPIVPAGKERLLPPEQFTRYTSETAKQLGRWLNYSPALIENLIRGYFGGTGKIALQGTDVLINSIRRSTGQKVVPKRPSQLADIPLVKGFVHRPPTGSVSRSVNDFFKSTDVIQKGWNTIKAMQKENRRTEIQGLLATNPEIKLNPSMTKFRARMSELTKQSDAVIRRNIPKETKKARLRKIDNQKLSLAKRANDLIRKAQEKAK